MDKYTTEELVHYWQNSKNDRIKERIIRLVLERNRGYVKNALFRRIKHDPLYHAEDFQQEANIAIIKKMETFDITRGIKFGSYCIWGISGIASVFRNKSMNLITPRPNNQDVENKGMGKVGDYPEVFSLDLKKEGFRENKGPWNKVEDEKFDYRQADAAKQLKRIMEINSLTDIEKDILKYRHGLIDGEGRTLEEVGEIVGLTRERVRQKIVEIFRKITCYVKSDPFCSFRKEIKEEYPMQKGAELFRLLNR